MIRPILYASTVMAALLAAAATASAAPMLVGDSNNSMINGVKSAVSVVGVDTLNTAPAVSFSTTVPGSNVEIGALTLNPAAGPSGSTTVTYDLILSLTSPTTATVNLGAITLTVTAETSPNVGTVTISGFSSLPSEVSLPDSLVLSDLTFVATATGGGKTGPTASYTSGTWTVVDPVGSGSSVLTISADVSVSVPEPTSLALLGTALIGLGFLRRRKNG